MAEENYMNQGPDVSPQVGMIGAENTGRRTGSGLSDPGENVESGGM